MKYIIVSALLIFSLNGFAQQCDEGSLLKQPGTWKDESTSYVNGVSATDLTAEKKTVAALHAMIKSKYIPMGVNVSYSRVYEPSLSNMPGNGYSYNALILNFYCEGNSIKTAHETSTSFSIRANAFQAEIYEEGRDDGLIGYHTMRDMPIEKDGYYYFKETDAPLGFGMTGKSSLWLITYDGKLPFAYVTKKEFLEKRKQLLSNQMLESAQGHKGVLSNIEIEKKYKEEEYKNDPSKLQKYMKMDYLPSKERYEKYLTENEMTYKPAFDKIEAQLKMPSTELSQPAIVKMDPNDGSYIFTDDNDPFGDVLIRPNPSYFKKLPKSSPQFFSVYVKGNHKDPIAKKATTDIMNAVDFVTLKNMLGK